MNTSASWRSGWFVGGVLVLAIGIYASWLHMRVSELQRQIHALQEQKELLQSVLAEREEQQELQKKLQEQWRQLADKQQTKQQEELVRLRQQVQQIPQLHAQNEQLRERLRQILSSRSLPVPRGSDFSSGSTPETQTYPTQSGALLSPTASLTNVALGKTVTTSGGRLYTGSLPQITDGVKDANQVVEIRKGAQWVQIDLGQEYPLYAVNIWHDYREQKIEEKFHDVIVQAASDPEFTQNVRTLFNNDTDNSSNLGLGSDQEYVETRQGKTINAQNIRTRFLRYYSRGSNLSSLNRYTEIEVYAFVGPNL